VAVVFISGCATPPDFTEHREAAVAWSEVDLENIAAGKEVAYNLLATWPFYSGFIRGALGTRIEQFPKELVENMDKLDEMAQQTEWTDQELGYSLGVRVQMASRIVMEILRQYAPEVLPYLPLLTLVP
jgi:hypothetical protein